MISARFISPYLAYNQYSLIMATMMKIMWLYEFYLS